MLLHKAVIITDRPTTAPAWMTPVLKRGCRDRVTSDMYVPPVPAPIAARGDVSTEPKLAEG